MLLQQWLERCKRGIPLLPPASDVTRHRLDGIPAGRTSNRSSSSHQGVVGVIVHSLGVGRWQMVCFFVGAPHLLSVFDPDPARFQRHNEHGVVCQLSRSASPTPHWPLHSFQTSPHTLLHTPRCTSLSLSAVHTNTPAFKEGVADVTGHSLEQTNVLGYSVHPLIVASPRSEPKHHKSSS